MRLLNRVTKEFEQFSDTQLQDVNYAILSHRWEDEELTYKEFLAEGGQALESSKKIDGFARITKYKYIWVDSLCINQESSAELTEAINRMYKMYRDAESCYVYLSDVSIPPEIPTLTRTQGFTDSLAPRIPSFRNSEWFKRGWTLQELIAPQHLEFYDVDWKYIGQRFTSADLLHEITRIPTSILRNPSTLKSFSIAQRMSWAARRITSRGEDRAYSLLGLFDISMPANYGEGSARAFLRLQEEIIKDSIDHSIFAWKHDKPLIWENPDSLDTLFADSPDRFESCDDLTCHPNLLKTAQPYWLNNTGLQITIPVMAVPQGLLDTSCLILNCVRESTPTRAVALVAYTISQRKGCYLVVSRNDTWAPRVIDVSIFGASQKCEMKTITICHSESQFRPIDFKTPIRIWLEYPSDDLKIISTSKGSDWNTEMGVLTLDRSLSLYEDASFTLTARTKTEEIQFDVRLPLDIRSSSIKGKLVVTTYPFSQHEWRNSTEYKKSIRAQQKTWTKLPLNTTAKLDTGDVIKARVTREEDVHEVGFFILHLSIVSPALDLKSRRRRSK